MSNEKDKIYFKWKDARLPLYQNIPEDVKLKIIAWQPAVNGHFYKEDVYIVLNGVKLKTTSELSFDIHCWVGKSADTKLYVRALYNAIAFDEALEGKALLHREVQGFESKRFTNYFEYFTVWKGNSDASYRNDQDYIPRLLHFHSSQGKNVCVKEKTLKRGSLDSKEVFIVDKGATIYQWNGERSNTDNKQRATQYTNKLKEERGKTGICVEVVEERDFPKGHLMYDTFRISAKKKKWTKKCAEQGQKTMCTMSSSMRFTKVAEGSDLCTRKMESTEVVVVDIRFGRNDADDHLYIRIGDDWDGDKKSGLIFGHLYLQVCPDKNPAMSITVVKEGQLSTQLHGAITS